MSCLRKFEYNIVPNKSFEVIHNCASCGQKESFINTKRFRVNANGNKLDIWLIYQCERCKHTLNIPIYERMDKRKVSNSKYELFLTNDEGLANRYGMNYAFFKRNRLEVDLENIAYDILKVSDNKHKTKEMQYQAGDVIIVHNPYGVRIRPEKIVSIVLISF
ncbi:DUF1062 domain-containing protein [Anaerosporobacter sp.]